MKAALAFLELVPGWLYATAIAGLLALCLWLDHDRADAYREASTAQIALANNVATSSKGAQAGLVHKAAKEDGLNANNQKVADELHQAIANPADRIADLERRLREQARPIARSGGECRAATTSPAQGSDGAEGARLRGLDGGNFLVLDGQGQSDIAALTISAKDTGTRLTKCRELLLDAWRTTNEVAAE